MSAHDQREGTYLYAAMAPQQTTRPYGFIRLKARSRISPPTNSQHKQNMILTSRQSQIPAHPYERDRDQYEKCG